MKKADACLATGALMVFGLLACWCEQQNTTIVSGLLLIACAAGLYGFFTRQSGNPVSLFSLLTISFLGGLGLGAMRLSQRHEPWSATTWVCFLGFYLFALWGYFLCRGKRKPPKNTPRSLKDADREAGRLTGAALAVSLLSCFTFGVEAVILGFIPFFSKETHAYNTFHVTGLHYFTVSCMLTHVITAVLLVRYKKSLTKKRVWLLIPANVLSLLVAIMCISKLQFIFVVGLPVLVLLADLSKKPLSAWPVKKLLFGLAAVSALCLFVFIWLTGKRHYEPGYLEEIFAMRDPSLPVGLQYAYMYVANNYANFDYLTKVLPGFSLGLKQLFPVFALTGLKFVFPALVNFPTFAIKEELNTLTLIYDAYYDFGIVGVCAFGAILGLALSVLEEKLAESTHPVWLMLYAQVSLYMLLSFFSSWFTVPTTWFYFGLTLLIGLFVRPFGPAGSQRERRDHETLA